MKKYIHYILFTFCLLSTFTFCANAAGSCSSTILYDEKINSSEITVDYETIETYGYDPDSDPQKWPEYYIKIHVNNVPDGIKIKVNSLNDSFDGVELDSSMRDENNNIVVNDYAIEKIKRMQFEIISTTKECNGEKLKTLTLNTPMFNELINAPVCSIYPDFKYCTAFTEFDVSSLSTTDFNKEFNDYLEQEEKKEEKESTIESVSKKIKKYWYIVLVIVVVLGSLIAFIAFKKKRSSDL